MVLTQSFAQRLTRDDAVTLLELITLCHAKSVPCTLREILPRIDTLLKVEFSLYGILNANGKGERSEQGRFLSIPAEAWFELAEKRNPGRGRVSLLAKAASFSLSHWSRGKAGSFPDSLLPIVQRHNLAQGYIFLHGNPSRNRETLLILAGTSSPETEAEGLISLLRPHLCHAAASSPNKPTCPCVNFSAREKDIITWMRNGKGNGDIALLLAISERTVKYHLQNIFRKLNVHNRSQAVIAALELGLVK